MIPLFLYDMDVGDSID